MNRFDPAKALIHLFFGALLGAAVGFGYTRGDANWKIEIAYWAVGVGFASAIFGDKFWTWLGERSGWWT